MNETFRWHERSPWTRALIIVSAFVLGVLLNHVASTWAVAGVILAAPNILVTPQWVMKQIGRRLVNNMRFANNVQRSYDDQYMQAGAKVGRTVSARLPQRYQVNKGAALNPQPVIDNVVPITLTDQANIGIEFDTASLTLEANQNYIESYISPAVDSLTNTIDFDGLSRMYKVVYQTVGTPGVIPGSTGTLPFAANLVYGAAKVKLDNGAVPADNRVAMLSSNMHMYLATAQNLVFNPSAEISKYYRKGQFGSEALGVSEWFMDQNVATHTVGPLGGTPLVDGAGQTGNSVLLKGWTAAAANRLKQGDVIQFAGVFAINPLNYQSTGQLADFTVSADTDSTGAGAMTVTFTPAIITSGALQTVTNSPADSVAVTIFGSASAYASVATQQGLIYHPEAFALVMADLELPGGLWVSERISNKELGIAIRFLKDYAIMTDMSPARVDVLYGWKEVRPEMAVRVAA